MNALLDDKIVQVAINEATFHTIQEWGKQIMETQRLQNSQREKAMRFRMKKMSIKHSSAHKPIYKDARRTHGFMPLGTKAKKIHWPSL